MCEEYIFLAALRDGLYKDIGLLISMAIVQGGQWPGFFHPVAYDAFALQPCKYAHELLCGKQFWEDRTELFS